MKHWFPSRPRQTRSGSMVSRELELRSLALLARAGERSSSDRLLRVLTPLLRGSVRRQLRAFALPIDESEDLVQEILLAVHVKIHTYDSDAPFTAWLRAIARHKVIDHCRSFWRLREASLHESGSVLAREDQEAAIASRDLTAVLRRLPPRTRRLIEATRIEGQSMAEAAREAAMAEAAARVAVHRGLKLLGRLFGQREA